MTSSRPSLFTDAILLAAIDKIVVDGNLYGRLGCEESDEEELREALGQVSPWCLDDSDRLARDFAEGAGMDVEASHFEIAEEMVSNASDIHRRLVAEWAASGDAERTVSDTLRVRVMSGGENLTGCAFVEPSYDKYGQFAFVPDEKLAEWRSPEGGVTSYRIVEWEKVVHTGAPTADDLSLVDGQRRRREAEAAASAESRLRADARFAVEKRRKDCAVRPEEAQAIWDELFFGDDVDQALRIHNAILLKATALEMEKLRG